VRRRPQTWQRCSGYEPRRCLGDWRAGVLSWEMFVSDLRHFLDMPDDAPGAARKMAEHLSSVVRAATLLDTDCERLVFQARASSEGIVLPVDDEDLDELMGFVAAEANHETNRRRQKRLDVVFAVLSDALDGPDS
jgi:hypothetical protein